MTLEIEGFGRLEWPSDCDDFPHVMRHHGFEPLTISQDRFGLVLWLREGPSPCIVEIQDFSTWQAVGFQTVREALDACARWSMLVLADSLSDWQSSLEEILKERVP